MSDSSKPREVPFVTFYSFKGGVGRSLCLINTAGILAGRGFKVLVIDCDLEAPGLSYLNPEFPEDPEARTAIPSKGFVDLLLDAKEKGERADLFILEHEALIEKYTRVYTIPKDLIRFPELPQGALHIMPAGCMNDEYARRLNQLGWAELYKDGVGEPLIRAFKTLIVKGGYFEYVLIDSRTGFSDEAGICTRDLADQLVILCGLNRQNVEGTSTFLKTLQAVKESEVISPLIVFSPIPNGEDALVEERMDQANIAFEAAWGKSLESELQIPYHPQLALTEEPHIFRRRKGYLFEAYLSIERELLEALGHHAEDAAERALTAIRNKNGDALLKCIRLSIRLDDQEIALGRVAQEAFTKENFAEAKSNPSLRQAFLELGEYLPVEFVYWALGEAKHEQEFPDLYDSLYKRLAEHDPSDELNLCEYADFLSSVRKDKSLANDIYLRAIEAQPESAYALGRYANFLSDMMGDQNGADEYFQRAVTMDPNDAATLGLYAMFLTDIRGDDDLAEKYFNLSIDADPQDPFVLGRYAGFLTEVRQNHDRAEDLYKQAIVIDPDDAFSLSRYAAFLSDVRNDRSAAEGFHRRAIRSDPSNSFVLGAYADFLTTDQRSELAEALYRKAIELDSSNPFALSRYARYMERIRHDNTRAQELYEQAVSIAPRDPFILGRYAFFLATSLSDVKKADEFYKRSIEAGSNDAFTLVCYAHLLMKVGADPNRIETLFRRAVEAHPNDAWALATYADFLGYVQNSLIDARNLYQRAIEASPDNARILSGYANFLCSVLREHDDAEKFYSLALKSDPRDAVAMGFYAAFLAEIRRAHDEAKDFYSRSLEIDPENPIVLGNYGKLLLTLGNIDGGLPLVLRSLANSKEDSLPQLAAECQMYLYCCAPEEEQGGALSKLKRLVLEDKVETGDWSFEGVIAQAVKMGHPEAEWLPRLASVLAGDAAPDTLAGWAAWEKA